MAEKRQDIQGDFNGQLANGNINNHHHYSESRLLNKVEVREIKQKVEQFMALSGKESVEVWGELKKILGAGVNELCLGQEKAARTILDLWIEREELRSGDSADRQAQLLIQVSGLKAKLSEAQAGNSGLQQQLNKANADLKAWHAHANTLTAREQQALRERDAVQQQLLAARQQIDALHQTKPARPLCQTCDSATRMVRQARRRFAIAAVTALAAILTAAWQGYAANQAQQATQAAEARLPICEYGSQQYRLGSVLDRQQGNDLRCVAADGKPAAWQEVPLPVAKAKNVRKKSASAPVKRSPPARRDKVTIEPLQQESVVEQLF